MTNKFDKAPEGQHRQPPSSSSSRNGREINVWRDDERERRRDPIIFRLLYWFFGEREAFKNHLIPTLIRLLLLPKRRRSASSKIKTTQMGLAISRRRRRRSSWSTHTHARSLPEMWRHHFLFFFAPAVSCVDLTVCQSCYSGRQSNWMMDRVRPRRVAL